MDKHIVHSAGADLIPMIVLVVVRSPILREGLNKFLTDAGVSVHCETPTPDDGLIIEAARHQDADLIVVDGSLCEAPSKLIPSLWQAVPRARIVIMAANDGLNRLDDEILAAADGILSSEISCEAMIQALDLIRLGARVVLPDSQSEFPGSKSRERGDFPKSSPANDRAALGPLPSPRETEILHCLVTGCSNKSIARQLGITEATVKVHLKGLLRKIRAANRTQAAVWALNNGMGPANGADRAVALPSLATQRAAPAHSIGRV